MTAKIRERLCWTEEFELDGSSDGALDKICEAGVGNSGAVAFTGRPFAPQLSTHLSFVTISSCTTLSTDSLTTCSTTRFTRELARDSQDDTMRKRWVVEIVVAGDGLSSCSDRLMQIGSMYGCSRLNGPAAEYWAIEWDTNVMADSLTTEFVLSTGRVCDMRLPGDGSCLIEPESWRIDGTARYGIVGGLVHNFCTDNPGVVVVLLRVGAGERLSPNELPKLAVLGRVLQLRERFDCLKAAAMQAAFITAGASAPKKVAATYKCGPVWKISLKALTSIYSDAKVSIGVRQV